MYDPSDFYSPADQERISELTKRAFSTEVGSWDEDSRANKVGRALMRVFEQNPTTAVESASRFGYDALSKNRPAIVQKMAFLKAEMVQKELAEARKRGPSNENEMRDLACQCRNAACDFCKPNSPEQKAVLAAWSEVMLTWEKLQPEKAQHFTTAATNGYKYAIGLSYPGNEETPEKIRDAKATEAAMEKTMEEHRAQGPLRNIVQRVRAATHYII